MPLSFINWPHGKTFAFTVFDDTDLATLEAISKPQGCQLVRIIGDKKLFNHLIKLDFLDVFA